MRISGNLKKKLWVGLLLIILIVFIKLFATNSSWVENYYSKNFYYFFSIFLRTLFRWIPVSAGDVLYFVTGLWIFIKIIRNTILLFKKKFTRAIFFSKLWNLFLIFTTIYIVFNIFWGLNYNRKVIGWQLQLDEAVYDTSNLKLMQ